MTRRKVFIYLPDLAAGGVERLTLNLLPLLSAAGYDPTLVLNTRTGALLPHVPANVPIISLDVARTLHVPGKLARLLRQERPEILLSNLGHNNIIAIWARALSRTSTRVVVCQHNALSQEAKLKGNWQHRVLPLVSRLFLRFADGIIAVSQGVADDMAEMLNLPKSAISVIYNPVLTEAFDARSIADVAHPWFAPGSPPIVIGVGRLVPQKDFATLLRAFALLRRKLPCRLVLVGDGPERHTLSTLADTLDVASDVGFLGFQENPLPYIKRAAVLAMSSVYEGFGNVLVEAMGCGTPVVSTDCPYGPSEILIAGQLGTLVPVGDETRLAQALEETLRNPPPSDRLRHRANDFSTSNISADYVALFDRLLNQTRRRSIRH